MKRILSCLAVGCLAASSCFGTFHARLWFKNETTGFESSGPVAASPGDLISCNYSFHRDAGDNSSRWTILQMFMDLDGTGPNAILTDDDANTWDAAFHLRYGILPNIYPTAIAWDPADGPIHDNGVDPSDLTMPEVTYKGVYALVGVNGSKVQSHEYDDLGFFTFHVGRGAFPGAELHWGREGDLTPNGIATRIYDSRNEIHGISDNWVTVVPEPSGPAALGVGLLGIGRLRRRRW